HEASVILLLLAVDKWSLLQQTINQNNGSSGNAKPENQKSQVSECSAPCKDTACIKVRKIRMKDKPKALKNRSFARH
ncbi:MAG: hypothetical protein KDC44_09960, partial [Phaeodactylibacter sp.]|nr:hypothetical protein [Phaeodactylibacter sp.]